MPTKPLHFTNVDACVDALIAHLGKDLRVGLPLGLGKPVALVNALYARAQRDSSLHLTLLTALTLEKPEPAPGLEAAFMNPFLDRVFADVPELAYARDQRNGRRPANVRVLEFFFRPGSRLDDAAAQRDFICTNYTFAARDVFAQGCNLVLQDVAAQADGTRYSLSCNPDTALELMTLLRAAQARGEREVLVVGAVNPALPWMGHDAEVSAETFDLILDAPERAGALFSTPKTPVALADHAIGLHVSALVRDGGTLQIGIGSLGDAIVHALRLRHEQPLHYAALLEALDIPARHGALLERIGGTAPFAEGLYAATEMFVDGLWHLLRAGVLRRRVYDHWALQELINDGLCDPDALDASVLDEMARRGVRSLRAQDFAMLQRHGLLRDELHYDEGHLLFPDGRRVLANLADPDTRRALGESGLGTALRGGILLHGGFFLGPRAFYAGLHALSEDERASICMTGVDKVNQLDRNPRLYRAQRRDARFINTGMMATTNGAVISDGLEDGRVVSGVGGQYNFVAQAHQLPGGRSILCVRAARGGEDGGRATSNIVNAYGHCTIPRHLRDVLVTEYGIADLRGQTDGVVAQRVLCIADSRFQTALLAQLQKRGTLTRDYRIPEAHRNNTPEALARRLRTFSAQLPVFPLGSDFTAQELRLAAALKQVKRLAARTRRWRLALRALRALREPRLDEALRADLARMDLLKPRGIQARVARALLVEALSDTTTRTA